MNNLILVTQSEMDRLFSLMPGDEAVRVLSFVDALAVFAAAADKKAAARAMAARLSPMGYRGLSLKSLYRKLDDFRNEGVWSLVPAKYKREKVRSLASNEAFVEHWQRLCLENRRKVRPAWMRLVRDFAAGVEIPGVGTWREMYLADRGYYPAAGEPCPWGERNPPPGWSLRNLRKFTPDEFAMVAAHRGMAEAKSRFGLSVTKTRIGLKCCRVVEVDDMWYEHAVIYPGNAAPQRVVEFAAMDRLTAHVICHLMKPIREKADGTRETLKAAWAKYVYHYVLCVSGIPPEGCIIRGERGTTKSDAELDAALAAINAWRKGAGRGEVAFEAGSLMNEPVAPGLPNGAPKGNPRHKGMIEQMHATLKNELGHVLGEVGGGRGVQPEETGAMSAEARKLITLAWARGVSVDKLKCQFLSWQDFAAAADRAHENIDRRTVHSLEGWAECGFMAGEVRLQGEASWRAVPCAAEMSPEESGAIGALVKAGYAEYRERRLSPKEAWEKSRKALEKVPDYFAPAILGSELCVVAKVNANMQFRYRDANVGSQLVVAAVAGDKLLERGREYRVWVNPLDGDKAYVADMNGLFLGVAKVMQAVRADATPEELAAQLGLRRRVLAEESRRLRPIVRSRLAAAANRAAANIAALGLEEPGVSSQGSGGAGVDVSAGVHDLARRDAGDDERDFD